MQDRDTGAGTPAAVAEPENAKQTADVARNDEQRRNEYTSRSRSELQALAAKFNTIRDNAGASGRARLREAEEPLASANRHLRALETAKESRWEDIRKQYETSFATARNAIERVSRGH
ncbi:MAG TPA: hypothetical protein VFV50_13175 [Bdellovibrionales bacterium]|nr:hypothetical protein [Bdellovibrionales bacterium]